MNVFLSRSNGQFEWAALGVDRQVKLGAESAMRPAEGLVDPFFWIAPAACWWARMVVESSMRHSRSGSCQTSKIHPLTSRLHHRLNRWKTEFHSPNRSGRSRHGAPVRTIQHTALMNNRLSSAARPGTPALPGSESLIFTHRSSEITCRRIT